MKSKIIIEIETGNPAPMTTDNTTYDSNDLEDTPVTALSPREIEASCHTELIKIIKDSLSLDHINDLQDSCSFDDIWMAGEDMDKPEDYSDLKITMQINPNKPKIILIDVKRKKEIDS